MGVGSYSIATIWVTQWRKKFREGTNKSDNDVAQKAQDSILNFETVKYFTAESYEVDRYKGSVINLQKFNSSTALSLSLLNVSQQFIMQATLIGSLVVAGRAVVDGNMTLGSWVAVNTWVMQIFVPLNFLGTVYAMIVQSLLDVRNLSELLSESPDLADVPDAKDLMLTSTTISNHPVSKETTEPEMVEVIVKGDEDRTPKFKEGVYSGAKIEFRDIHFNYPSQPVEKGLKGVSFSVLPGTTTAIVGTTGSGKTTLSRLLFRFYDPREGQVLIDNKDIKMYTQKSVRRLTGNNSVLFFI